MRRDSKISIVAVLLGFIFCFVILNGPAAAKTYTWRLSTIMPPASSLGQGLNMFADKVNKKTNGQMKIKIGFSSSFGGWADSMKAVSMGSLEMVTEDISRWEVANKDFKIVSFPYTFSGWEHYLKWMDSPLFQEMVAPLAKRNYHVLLPNKRAAWKRGPFRAMASKKPIFTVDDYQNLKLRLPEVELSVRVFRYMGCKPTVIPWGEAYLALKQGMVEAITTPMDHVYGMKFHEVAPYITNINEFLQNNMITVNKSKWDELPDNIKKAMEDASVEVAEWSNGILYSSVEEETQKILNEGGFFIRVGLGSFKKKIAPLAMELEGEGWWSKGLYEKIRGIN